MAESIHYVGEVIVSELDGRYLGNFSGGPAIDAPVGFSRSQATPYGVFPCGAINWVISPWWEPPNTFEACAFLTDGKQPDLPIGISQFGLLNGSIVADDTGPTGWEDHLAVELDGSGTGLQDSFYFIGETASQRHYINGPDYLINPWRPALFSHWTYECYARAVPDDTGYVMSGCTLGFGYSQPWFDISHTAAGDLTEDWQFFQEDVFIFWQLGYPFTLAGFWVEVPLNNELHTEVSDGIWPPMDYTKWGRKGRFRVKEFHVYPRGAAVITPGIHLHPTTIG